MFEVCAGLQARQESSPSIAMQMEFFETITIFVFSRKDELALQTARTHYVLPLIQVLLFSVKSLFFCDPNAQLCQPCDPPQCQRFSQETFSDLRTCVSTTPCRFGWFVPPKSAVKGNCIFSAVLQYSAVFCETWSARLRRYALTGPLGERGARSALERGARGALWGPQEVAL